MNITRLYDDFGIIYADEEHRHHRPGWVNTECPLCAGNPGLHLGYHTDGGYYYCWRCGWHPIRKVIAKLLNIDEDETKKIIKQYGGHVQVRKKDPPKSTRPFQLPTGTAPLSNAHKQYLSRRGFDPDRLEREWGLLGTGPVSQLDGIEYKHRIIAPIKWDGSTVSFQGRDITDRHRLKYKACPAERELVPHQKILYGDQSGWDGGVGICVEGITDVWRFGPVAFATFGIEYTQAQLLIISRMFKRVFIIFDDEVQATGQAYKIMKELQFKNVQAERIPLVGDPGGLKQADADYLIKHLLK